MFGLDDTIFALYIHTWSCSHGFGLEEPIFGLQDPTPALFWPLDTISNLYILFFDFKTIALNRVAGG